MPETGKPAGHGIATITRSDDDERVHAVQGVIFAVIFAVIVRVTWGRANTGARIGAIVVVLFAVWLGVELVNAPAAALMASWTSEGAVQDIAALGHIVSALAR
jgi:hypothetical protein